MIHDVLAITVPGIFIFIFLFLAKTYLALYWQQVGHTVKGETYAVLQRELIQIISSRGI